jgi:hypothetical protein
MEFFAAMIIAMHGLLYWVVGTALLFRCIRDRWIVFIEEQLQVDSKKEDVEVGIAENPESHRLALRFAAYIMVFLGGLRISVAYSDSCVVVGILAHTFVCENLLIVNELIERKLKGIGWVGCVFVVNAALVGLVAVSARKCVE